MPHELADSLCWRSRSPGPAASRIAGKLLGYVVTAPGSTRGPALFLTSRRPDLEARRHFRRAAAPGALIAVLTGCGASLPTGLDSLDPGERSAAIAAAAESRDRAAVPKLIEMLDSDDPGTRLLAIQALERITGETFGYDYTAPDAIRRESIGRWVQWQSRQPLTAGSS